LEEQDTDRAEDEQVGSGSERTNWQKNPHRHKGETGLKMVSSIRITKKRALERNLKQGNIEVGSAQVSKTRFLRGRKGDGCPRFGVGVRNVPSSISGENERKKSISKPASSKNC